MLNTRNRIIAVTLVSLLGLIVSHSPGADDKKAPWKEFLPKKAYDVLLSRSLDKVRAAVETGKEGKIIKGRLAAMMIAGYTLSVDGDEKKLAAIRAAALRLAHILGDNDKKAETQKLVASIASGKGDPSAKHQGLNFRRYVPNDYELMVPYMMKKRGGAGLHPDLQFSRRLRDSQEYIENLFSYVARRPLRERYLKPASKELALLGYQTAVSAEIIDTYQPKRKTRTRDPKIWKETSIAMRDSAIAFAKAAHAKDAQALQKASEALLKSCVDCHKMFQ